MQKIFLFLRTCFLCPKIFCETTGFSDFLRDKSNTLCPFRYPSTSFLGKCQTVMPKSLLSRMDRSKANSVELNLPTGTKLGNKVKIFSDRNFHSDRKFLSVRNFFQTENFFLTENIFLREKFQSDIFLSENFFRTENFCRTENFFLTEHFFLAEKYM